MEKGCRRKREGRQKEEGEGGRGGHANMGGRVDINDQVTPRPTPPVSAPACHSASFSPGQPRVSHHLPRRTLLPASGRGRVLL